MNGFRKKIHYLFCYKKKEKPSKVGLENKKVHLEDELF